MAVSGKVRCSGNGLWRSLVARLTGGQEVAGSNPASPTGGGLGLKASRRCDAKAWLRVVNETSTNPNEPIPSGETSTATPERRLRLARLWADPTGGTRCARHFDPAYPRRRRSECGIPGHAVCGDRRWEASMTTKNDALLTQLARFGADVVLINGNVVTMDPARPRAEEAAEAGRIVAVGTAAEVMQAAVAATRVNRTCHIPRVCNGRPSCALRRTQRGGQRRRGCCSLPTLEQAGGADRFRRLRGLVVDGYLPGAARLERIGAAFDHHPRHHGRRVASSGVGNGDASTTRGARRR